MKRKLILILIVSLTLTTLTGCWNRRELNELGFVVAIGVDKADDGQYLFTVQMVDPSEVASRKGGGGRTPVTAYRTKGKTLYEAAAKLTTFAPRAPYWAHNQIYIYGEAVAREGIGKLIDVHEREHEVRSNFYFVIAKDTKAYDVLQILTPMEEIPARKMFDSLKTAAHTVGSTVEIRRDELVAALTSDGRDAVLSGLQVIGDVKKGKEKDNVETIYDHARLQYRDVGVFHADKLVGWLNEEESKGFNFTQGKLEKTFIGLPCTGGKMVVELIRSEHKIKGQVQHGKPQIKIQIIGEANLSEVECASLDVMQTATIAEMEAKLNAKVRSMIIAAIEKCQTEYKADIFGFGEVIHRADPVAWRTLKTDWRKHFAKTQVDVSVDMRIRRIGTISTPPQNVIKE